MNASLTENFVSVSDFSQGKANKIFNDISKNDHEYVVLKNNRPAAVVVSARQYETTQKKIKMLGELLEQIDDEELFMEAESRLKHAKKSDFVDFKTVIEESGFSMKELNRLSEVVELE